MLKVHKEKKEASLVREQDKGYRKDFWKTAKDVTNGTFESSPTYNKATADKFYKDQYEHPVNIDLEKLDWFPSVEPPTVPYNLSAFQKHKSCTKVRKTKTPPLGMTRLFTNICSICLFFNKP